MRYLWEVLLEAKKEQIPEERLRFVHAPQGSGYMELSLPCLNQTWLGEEEQPEDINIEVNTYYRFYDIFCEMFPPDEAEFPSLRESLTNLCLHMLAQNDIRMGMTREDYHKRLLAKEILDGNFGEIAVNEQQRAGDIAGRMAEQLPDRQCPAGFSGYGSWSGGGQHRLSQQRLSG